MKSQKPRSRRRTTGPKQARVASLLASGATVRAAAKEAGVSERTIYDWQACDPGFPKLVAQYRNRLVERTLGRLAAAAGKAVKTLESCLGDGTADGVRVRAALGILEQMVRIREHGEMAGRVADLEERVDRAQGGSS